MLGTIHGAYSQLKADFYTDKTGGCSPLVVNFTNATRGASPEASYFWELGNGNTSTLKDPGAVYTEPKNYPIKLTVTDNGKVSVKQLTVTVYKNPTADFTVADPKVCWPSSVELVSASDPGDGYISSYTWDFGNGSTRTSSLNRISYQFGIGKVPAVNLTVSNNYGCVATVIRENLAEVLEPMLPSFTIDKTLVCDVADPVSFNADATRGPGTLKYEWQLGDGSTETAKNPVHVFNRKDLFTPVLKITNEYGCQQSVTGATINVAYFNTSFTDAMLCREVRFSASNYWGVNPTETKWDFGDLTYSSQTNSVQKIYAAAGKYTVRLERTYNNVCKEVVEREIEVLDNVDYQTAIGVPEKGCIESGVNLSSFSSVTPSSVHWDFGNGQTNSWSTYPSVTYSAPGTYTVSLTNTFGTCKEKVEKQIVIHALPDVKPFDMVFGSPCGAPVLMSFKDNTPDAVSWNWQLNHYPISTTLTGKNPSFNCTLSGSYSLGLTVKNAEGCAASTSGSFYIPEPPRITVRTLKTEYAGGALSCTDIKVRLAASGTEDIVGYNWDAGEGGTSTAKEPEFIFAKQGNYPVKLNYITENGCTGTVNYQVSAFVSPGPPVVTTYTINTEYPGGIYNCGDLKVKLGFNSTEPLADFNWNPGTGIVATDKEPEFSFTKEGYYTIRFNYTLNNGCKGQVIASNLVVYEKHKADFTYQEAACSDQIKVGFKSTTTPATSYAWDFGNGYWSSAAAAPSNIFPDTGTYEIKHRVYNGGCTDMITKTVHVSNLPKLVRITSVSPQSCSGSRGEIVFNQSSSQATGLLWNFGDGTTQPNDTANHRVTHTYARTGNYTITLTAKSGSCQLQSTAQTTVLLKQKPKLSASSTSLCTNQTLTLSITGLETNPYVPDYPDWLLRSNQYRILKFEYADGTPFDHYYATAFDYTGYSYSMSGIKPGIYQLRAIIANNYLACYDTTNYVNIEVRGPAAAAFNITTNNVCWKNPVLFEDASRASGIPIESWYWSFGDGNYETTTTSSNPAHTYSSPGNYFVSLTVTDANGCKSTASAGYAVVRGPKVAFTPTGLYVPNVPLNTTVTFVNQTNATNSSGINYHWDYGNGVISDQFTGLQTYPKAGDYTIKLTATDPLNGCTDEDSSLITVRDFNTAFKFNAAYLGAGTCPPVRVDIRNLSVNATSYSWDFGDGFRIEGVATPSHVYTTPGKKVITLYSQGYNNLKGVYKDSIIIEASAATLEADILTGCTGQEVALLADAVDTHSYLWDFGDGTLKQSTEAPEYKHAYLSAGLFAPQVLVRDEMGCGSTAGITEKIFIDSLGVSVSDIPEDLCQYSENLFIPAVYSLAESSRGEPLTYNWEYGTGDPGHGTYNKEGAFIYDVPGNYTIRLKVSSPYCVKEDSREVIVHEKFGLVLSAPEQVDVCKNNSVPIIAKGGYSYEWINETAGLSDTQIGNPVATPETDVTYTVVGFDRWKCSSDTSDIKVIVRPLPEVDAGPDGEVLANTGWQLQPTGSSDIIQWTWTPADYLSCVNCVDPITRPKRDMEYVLMVNTRYNCIARDTVQVKASCLKGFVHIPNSFTPNGDGRNDRFYIMGKGIGNIRSLRIFNRWGELVFERHHFDIDDPGQGWDGKYNGRPASPGSYVYFAEMKCAEDGTMIVKKGTVTVTY